MYISIYLVLIDLDNSFEKRLDFDENDNDVTSKINEAEQTSCVVCQKTYSNSRRLQTHQIKKHSARSDQHLGKEHQCDKCEKRYTTRANLLIHERTHTGIPQILMIVCHKQMTAM